MKTHHASHNSRVAPGTLSNVSLADQIMNLLRYKEGELDSTLLALIVEAVSRVRASNKESFNGTGKR